MTDDVLIQVRDVLISNQWLNLAGRLADIIEIGMSIWLIRRLELMSRLLQAAGRRQGMSNEEVGL